MTLQAGEPFFIPFDIPATELAAGTPIDIVSPVAGWVKELQVIVQTAIVTGGAVTVKVGTTDVTGLSAAIADAATKGTVVSDEATDGTTTRRVEKGGRIQIVPDAAFAGGGALAGNLLIDTVDLSPVAQY